MSMPQSVRHINEIRVLQSLFKQDGASRADLARHLGLTRSTIGNIVTNLIASGAIREQSDQDLNDNARVGRPRQGLELNRNHAFFIGADIGAERLTVIALDFKGDIIDTTSKTFDYQTQTPAEIIHTLCGMIDDMAQALPEPNGLRGVCVTLPGIVADQETLIRAPALNWTHVPVLALIKERIAQDCRILIENDANAFAAGELYRNRLPERGNTLCVLLETGIGGAVISEGRLMRGHRGYAGEVGHIFIGDRGYSNFSSMSGTFESLAGVRALLARAEKYCGTPHTLKSFIDAVKREDANALKAFDEWTYWLGRGLAALVCVLDPERIVIGGALSRLVPLAREGISNALAAHLFPGHPQPDIMPSEVRANGPALGGALILLRDFLAIDEQIVFSRTDMGAAHLPMAAR